MRGDGIRHDAVFFYLLCVVRGAVNLQPVTAGNTSWWSILFISNSTVAAIRLYHRVISRVHFALLERAAITANFVMRSYINCHFYILTRGLRPDAHSEYWSQI